MLARLCLSPKRHAVVLKRGRRADLHVGVGGGLQAGCRFPFNLSLLIFHVVTDKVTWLPIFHSFQWRHSLTSGSRVPDGGARPFAPFIWHNLAFDPFNLSPSARASTGVPRWVISKRFLTLLLSPPTGWW